MTTQAFTPTLAEVIRLAVECRLVDLHVSMPAVVEAYDATKGTVEVVPLLMVPGIDGQGKVSAISLPKLVGVPLVFQGGGGARATFPVAVGDFVTIVFADRSMDVWKGNGSKTPVDPGEQKDGHAIANAWAIPGLRPIVAPWANAPTDRATFGYDSGARIEVLPAEIDLGHGASDQVLKGNAFMTALDTLIAAIATAMSAITIGAPAGGAPAGTAITTAKTAFDTAASSFLSSLVKTA